MPAKPSFTAHQRMLGHSAMRRIYCIPRNRMLSAVDLQREIDSLTAKRAKGSLDDVGEALAAEFAQIGLL